MFLGSGTGNTVAARRYRELFATMVEDIGGDPSEAMTQLIRRAVMISLECEQMESDAVNGAEINLDRFTTASNALRRILESLGVRRVKDAVPDLKSYLASKVPSPGTSKTAKQPAGARVLAANRKNRPHAAPTRAPEPSRARPSRANPLEAAE